MEDWMRMGKEADDRHDYKKAIEYYQKAAINGNPYQAVAEYELGNLYYDGNEEIAQDFTKALQWYTKAAEHKNSDAMCQLATMYVAGEGVEQDEIKAAAYLQQGVELGDDQAMALLGKCYAAGIGIEKDKKQALQLSQDAAAKGNAIAMNDLGNMYREGVKGILEADLTKAREWYQKAVEAGFEGAEVPLKEMTATANG